MIIKNIKPPIYDDIIAMGMRPSTTTVFTYGDTLYNPQNLDIPDHLVAHEEVHAEQQGHSEEGADEWWDRYLVDPYFRIDQEAKAYAAQYDFICGLTKDRERRVKFLVQTAAHLAGPVYGNIIDQSGAMQMIKTHIKTKK